MISQSKVWQRPHSNSDPKGGRIIFRNVFVRVAGPNGLKARAWRVAREAARVLREQFGAKRVVVFGSLVHQLWYSPQSDIDMAVWGIAPGDFLRAYGAAERIASGFELNLVDPKECFPSIRRSIEKNGIEV